MDRKIDLTKNRDFSNNNSGIIHLNEIINTKITVFLNEYLEKKNHGKKKIIQCINNKVCIDVYEDNIITCDCCGRLIINEGLCDNCELQLKINNTIDDLFKKKELISIL